MHVLKRRYRVLGCHADQPVAMARNFAMATVDNAICMNVNNYTVGSLFKFCRIPYDFIYPLVSYICVTLQPYQQCIHH